MAIERKSEMLGEVKDKEIIFIVDTSKSMEGDIIDYLKELISDIYVGYKNVFKRIICFNEDYKIFDLNELSDFECNGKTYLDKGIEGLYSYLKKEDHKERIIFFISDFIANDYSESNILNKLKDLNNFNNSLRYGLSLGTDYDSINNYLLGFVNGKENLINIYTYSAIREVIEAVLYEFISEIKAGEKLKFINHINIGGF